MEKGTDNMKKGEEVDACTHASAGTAGEARLEEKARKTEREVDCDYLVGCLGCS